MKKRTPSTQRFPSSHGASGKRTAAADLPLLFLAAAVPLAPTQVGGFPLRQVIFLLCGAAALLLLPFRGGTFEWRARFPATGLDRSFLLWTAVVLAGALAAPNPGFAAFKTSYLLCLGVLFYAFTVRVRSEESARRLLFTFGAAAAVVAVVELAALEGLLPLGEPTGRPHDPKVSVLFIHAYLAAQFLLPVAVLLLALAVHAGPSRRRAWAALFSLPVALYLVVIGSRGTYLAGLIALAVLLFLSVRSRLLRGGLVRTARALLPLGLVVAILVVLLSSTGAFGPLGRHSLERVLDFFNPDLLDFNFSRLRVWRDALNLAADHLFLGTGPGNFPMLFPEYQRIPQEFGVLHAHNQFMEVLCENGVPGLLCFLAVVLVLLGKIRRGGKGGPGKAGYDSGLRTGAVAALAGAGTYCLFETPLEWPASAACLLLPVSILILPGPGSAAPAVPAGKGRWPWIVLFLLCLLCSVLPGYHLVRAVRSGLHGNRGYTLYRAGRLEAAAAELEQAVRTWPYRPEVYSTLALIHVSLGEHAAALDAARRSLALRPGTTEMLLVAWRALSNLGRCGESIPYLRAAMERSSSAGKKGFLLGQTLLRAGRIEAALIVFQDLYKTPLRRTMAPDLQLALARCRIRLGEAPLQAAAVLEEARRRGSRDRACLEQVQELARRMEHRYTLAGRSRIAVDRIAKRVQADLDRLLEKEGG